MEEKNKKFRKGRLSGIADSGSIHKLSRSIIYGLRVIEPGYLTLYQIEAARKALQKFCKRQRRVKLLKFCMLQNWSKSKKKRGIRMGGSKGRFYGYVVRVRPGNFLCHITNLVGYQLFRRLNYAVAKLPVQVQIVVIRH